MIPVQNLFDVIISREQQLIKLAELQKKLDAAEKVEIYRRIRVRRGSIIIFMRKKLL